MITKEAIFVYNYATKLLAGKNPGDPVSEAWRIPLVLPYYSSEDSDFQNFNEVTFIYALPAGANIPGNLAIAGTFGLLQEPIPLVRVEQSRYYYLTLKLPKGQVYYYKYLVDGLAQTDPINPQKFTSATGENWSRFFTCYCTHPLCFERWETEIIDRFASHILPFRTRDGQRFFDYFYYHLDSAKKEFDLPGAYRLDQTVGVTNFIDKLLAKEEAHHLVDYKICLKIIRQILKSMFPLRAAGSESMQAYITLYNQMGSGNVPGWDYQAYNNPAYFLQLLRRHVFTGAFAHPKYGGNSEAAGWQYLAEQKLDTGEPLFNWRKAIEMPLGTNEEYLG